MSGACPCADCPTVAVLARAITDQARRSGRALRNCDLYRGRDEAIAAYVRRCCALTDAPVIKVQTDIFDFLFAPAAK